MKPRPIAITEASALTTAREIRSTGPNAITATGSTMSARTAIPPNQIDKATSAPQAMRRASRPRSIVIGVFKFAALPLHLADQISQFLDLDVESQPAPSWARLDRNGEQLARPRRRQRGVRPRQNGRENAPISGDFKDVPAARPELAQDFGIFLIARRLDQHGPDRQISDFHDPRLGREVVRAQRRHDASDPEIIGRKPGQGAEGDRIDRLAAVFQGQRHATLQAPDEAALSQRRLAPEA